MISRYALFDIAELSNRFSISEGLPKGVKPNYNFSPTAIAPVIVSENGTPVVKLMTWGLLAKGAKDTNSVFRYKTYNHASETIFSRHSWETAVRERRCLVPANGFYELNGSGKKRAFYAEPKNKEMVAFAGIYSEWEDAAGITQRSFSLLTTEASSDMPNLSGRMPLVVDREQEARWIDTAKIELSTLYSLLRPNPSGLFTAYEVSPAVHSPKPNHADLIKKI